MPEVKPGQIWADNDKRCIEKATLVEEVAAAIETAGGTPPTTCPPAAPESTHANETTPAPRIHHPKGERPSETLTALREHVEDLDDLIRQERAIHEETIRRAERAEAAIARLDPAIECVLIDHADQLTDDHGRVDANLAELAHVYRELTRFDTRTATEETNR